MVILQAGKNAFSRLPYLLTSNPQSPRSYLKNNL
jgi:hypothetical protein